MATTNRTGYSASAALTITLDALAAATARQSGAVDNTATLYLDAQVQASIPLAAGSPSSTKTIDFYVAGSEDGTKWPGEGAGNNDGVTGLDAAVGLESPTNLRLLGSVVTPAAGGKTYVSSPMSVAAAFGGVLPRKWSVIVANNTGLAFGTGCAVTYTGLTVTNS